MVEESKIIADQQYGEGQETKIRKKSKYTLDESVLDHKLRQKLWEGLIPLKIDLDLNDIKSSQKPRSLYVSSSATNNLDYGASWKLFLCNNRQRKSTLRPVCTLGQAWKLRRDVFRVQQAALKVEYSYRRIVWLCCRSFRQKRGDPVVFNLPLSQQPSDLVLHKRAQDLPLQLYEFP